MFYPTKIFDMQAMIRKQVNYEAEIEHKDDFVYELKEIYIKRKFSLRRFINNLINQLNP